MIQPDEEMIAITLHNWIAQMLTGSSTPYWSVDHRPMKAGIIGSSLEMLNGVDNVKNETGIRSQTTTHGEKEKKGRSRQQDQSKTNTTDDKKAEMRMHHRRTPWWRTLLERCQFILCTPKGMVLQHLLVPTWHAQAARSPRGTENTSHGTTPLSHETPRMRVTTSDPQGTAASAERS